MTIFLTDLTSDPRLESGNGYILSGEFNFYFSWNHQKIKS